VELSWEPARPEPHHYVILRSPSPINSDTYPGKTEKVDTVPAGTTSFRHTPPDGAPYYYGVLSAGKEGSVHSLFIPHRNVTAEPAALSSPSPKKHAAHISSITAEASDDSVVVRIETDRIERPILLYRSTSPILSADDVVQANLIATIGEGKRRYTDFPLAGVEYYYAALDARLAESGSYRFSGGRNSTAEGVKLPLGRAGGSTPSSFAAEDSPRGISAPLPFLQVSRSIVSGEPISSPTYEERESAGLSEKTRRTVNELLSSLPSRKEADLQPTVLPEDRDSPRNNDEQMLKTILEGPFSERDWESTEKRLGQLLSTRIGENVERRAHFYLAQTYYFQQEHTSAFFEFVLLEDTMYDSVRPWMYRILELR
jgi:hypothetical protein